MKRRIAIFAAIFAATAILALTGCGSQKDSARLPEEMTPGCQSLVGMEDAAVSGRATYRSLCTHCHQKDGIGVPGMVPSLADSGRLAADPEQGLRSIIASQSPSAHIDGMAVLDLVAPLEQLSDSEIADVLNYVLNAWGNCAGTFSAQNVGTLRLTD